MRTWMHVAVFGLVACAPASSSPTSTAVAVSAVPLVTAPSVTVPSVTAPSVTAPASLGAAVASAGPGGPGDTLDPVTERALKLAEAPSVRELALQPGPEPAKLSADDQHALDALAVVESRVPLVVPPQLASWASVVHVGAPDWRTLTLHGDGVMVVLTGRTTVLERPAIAAELDGLSMYGVHQVVDGIRTVTFERYGLPWALDVECAQAGDPRCTEPAYADTLVATLVRVAEAN